MCTDVFGPQFTRETIDANVRKTNAYYGGALGYNVSPYISIYQSVMLDD